MHVPRLMAFPLAALIALGMMSGPASPLAGASPAPSIIDTPLGDVFGTAIGPDGTSYAVGNFTAVGAWTGGLSLLDGTTAATDRSYPRLNGQITAAVSDGSGGWFVGGSISSLGGVNVVNVAHILSDGTVDPDWSPRVLSGTVWALAMRGTTLYVGGSFSNVDGQSRPNAAAIDTTTGQLLPWNPSPDQQVQAIATDASAVYLGGSFTSLGATTRNGIAAVDPSTGAPLTWNPDANGTVYTLAVSGSLVYAGGAFTSIGGQGRNRLAALNAHSTGFDTATSWNPDISGTVQAVAIDGTTVYAGGSFTTVNGGNANRNNVAAFDITTATVTNWNPNANGPVTAILPTASGVYIGGEFPYVGGSLRISLARVDSTTGAMQSWDAGIRSVVGGTTVRALLASGSDVLVGGLYTHVNPTPRNYAAAFDSDLQVTNWNPALNNAAYDIIVDATTAYMVGSFTSVNGNTSRRGAAAVSTTTGIATSWNPDISGYATALDIDGNIAYLGGFFSSIGGASRSNIGSVRTDDTGTVTTWDPGANSYVYDVVVDSGIAYLGGIFATVGGEGRIGLAAVDAATGIPTSWNPSPYGSVEAIEVVDGIAYIGGAFTSVGGSSRRAAAAVRLDDGTVTAWNPSLTCDDQIYFMDCMSVTPLVNDIEVIGGTAYLGGAFTTVGGTDGVLGLAAVSTSGAGARVNSWSPSVSSAGTFPTVNSLTASGTTLLVGGFYSGMSLGLATYSGMASWLPLPNPSAPAAPTGVVATPGDGQASIAWTSGSNGGSAVTRVEFALDDTTTVDDSTTNPSSPHTITGLTNGHSYVVYVRQVNSIGTGAWSAASSAFTPQSSTPTPSPPQPAFTLPGQPRQVSADPGNAQATVTWLPPTDTGSYPIDGYVVTTNPGGRTCSTASTSCTVTGLTNGTSYTFTVTASSAAGTGPASAPSAPVTPRTVPSPPTAVNATPGDARATITWSPPTDDGGSPITGYRVTTIPTSDGCTVTATTCTLDGLTNSREYVVNVIATNVAGSSPPATVTVTPRGKASIVITGSRTGKGDSLVRVKGQVRGLDVATVQPFYRLAKQRAFRSSSSPVPVMDGSFTWQRTTSKRITVYVEAGDLVSNRVTISAR